jgi:hypothetical protein
MTQTTTTRKRLNLDLSANSYELLQLLSEETGKNMADVLRTGLSLYGMAHEANKKGQGIGIVQGDKVLKEILLVG